MRKLSIMRWPLIGIDLGALLHVHKPRIIIQEEEEEKLGMAY